MYCSLLLTLTFSHKLKTKSKIRIYVRASRIVEIPLFTLSRSFASRIWFSSGYCLAVWSRLKSTLMWKYTRNNWQWQLNETSAPVTKVSRLWGRLMESTAMTRRSMENYLKSTDDLSSQTDRSIFLASRKSNIDRSHSIDCRPLPLLLFANVFVGRTHQSVLWSASCYCVATCQL